MTTRLDKVNTIIGTTELTIQVRNQETVNTIAKEIHESPELANRITTIDILTDEGDDKGEEEQEKKILGTSAVEKQKDELVSSQTNEHTEAEKKDTKHLPSAEERLIARKAAQEEGARLATRLCEPLIQILHSTTNLKHFHWRASYCAGTSFTRPHSFWAALFSHSLSLQTLQLDYFEREVDQLPLPQTTFPKLQTLKLNAVSAHGDDGTAIDALLASCPSLVYLDFAWPRCDLDGCQIQNIFWGYGFPLLTRVSLSGWNFAPKSLHAFLERHATVETFSDGIDYYEGDSGSEPRSLDKHVLPNLRALNKSSGPLTKVQAYFNEDAKRPIRHLALHVGFHARSVLTDLSKLPRVKAELEILELHGNVTDWRELEPDSSDEDGEDEGDDKESYQHPAPMPQVLRACLAGFEKLQELGLGLESGLITHRRKDGKFGHPDAATAEDLKYLLSHIPQTIPVRALRIWDGRAETLPQDFLDDLPPVPDYLEYFDWEGEERAVLRLERKEGKVRAVVHRDYRGKKAEAEILTKMKKDWSGRRVLDFY
ncbi:hypothetical protein BKA66DRAFT_470399 [Pyrenochaeta sp. MPI-SDFR-AT-0127]|nr:hypothetical protein BKA66DRAFT_470399 [Pyrenochaeta sp. MPI-SDFR-AT-0127]